AILAVFYGYRRLITVDDWRGLAGDDKWVASRSAYELAHAWQSAGGVPSQVRRALEDSDHSALKGLAIDLCLVDARRAAGSSDVPSVVKARSLQICGVEIGRPDAEQSSRRVEFEDNR